MGLTLGNTQSLSLPTPLLSLLQSHFFSLIPHSVSVRLYLSLNLLRCTWHSSTMTKPPEGLTRSCKTGMYIMSS